MDKRWRQLGEILVGHSTAVQPGERVYVAMQEIETLPLVRVPNESFAQQAETDLETMLGHVF